MGGTIQRITDDNRGNVGRSATVYAPAAQASTSSWVLLGAVIDTINDSLYSVTIHNTGLQTISWKILAGNTATIDEAIEIKASADIAASARDSSSNTSLVWRYYGIYIEDKVGGSHGEATAVIIHKG
jgi:hypothetical protein